MAEAEWGRTRVARERVKSSPFYEESDKKMPNGEYKGRPIIGRDIPINGGVYLGAYEREALVVEDKTDVYLGRLYDELIRRMNQSPDRGKQFKANILPEIFSLVKENMPYDSDKVDAMASINGWGRDVEVALGNYVKEHAGVCRHQALLAGYLIERLCKEGYLKGGVSIDRNTIKYRGGHAWMRFTDETGQVYILDAAQHYLGKLEDVDRDSRWFYERPEDKIKK